MHPLADRIREANRLLRPGAVPHEGVQGRSMQEPDDDTRFPFQRDRDRILQTTAFRRLQGKTQVFVAGEGDHFRTRLTHTMEVAQIGRDIGCILRLNEDLIECIALAHDLGHPPFGHMGEAALDAWMRSCGGHFEHNEQSFRIVTLLEKRSDLYDGLNVNREVEEGLLKHETVHPEQGHMLIHTLEAQVANLADEIAYVSHDCDDGLLAGLFSFRELTDIPLARAAYERSAAHGTHIRGSIVHLLVADLLASSADGKRDDERIDAVRFSEDMRSSLNELRGFLAERMYPHPRVLHKAREGQEIIHLLCRFYLEHPTDKIRALRMRHGSSDIEAVKDYVAGMTDAFAWLQAAEHGLLPVEEAGP